MAATRVVCIIGHPDAGKTSITVALASEFTRQGRRVGTIRLADQPADVMTRDTDTWRHFNEGHPEATLFHSPGFRVLFERTPAADGDVQSLVRRFHAGRDIVLIEGQPGGGGAIPRIEVYRRRSQDRPIFDPETSDPTQWIALLTDDAGVEVPFPTFRFNDTAWLMTLTHLVWERAMLLKE